MQVTRIAIDGLWRSLCPSFDAIAAPPSLRLALTCTSFERTKRLSKSVSCRSIHCSKKLRLQEQDDAAVTFGRIKPSKTSGPVKNASPAHAGLDDVPVRELYDTLHNVGAEDRAYKRITDLVDYLITSRGEKPSLILYDALIRANADASHGSANAVANLLREVKEANIVPDSNLYHSALQVRLIDITVRSL